MGTSKYSRILRTGLYVLLSRGEGDAYCSLRSLERGVDKWREKSRGPKTSANFASVAAVQFEREDIIIYTLNSFQVELSTESRGLVSSDTTYFYRYDTH